MTAIQINEVLHFWFNKTSPEQRFIKDEAFDETIKTCFLWLHSEIVAWKHDDWDKSPRWLLAKIIVLDQFSRNMFRWDKKSFAYDDMALGLAQKAIESWADQELPYEYRSFMYMPYMHSESKQVHEKAFEIFQNYGNEVNLEYEIKHKEIIDRFGRYPHRNKVLGRESTAEELEFLKTHSWF